MVKLKKDNSISSGDIGTVFISLVASFLTFLLAYYFFNLGESEEFFSKYNYYLFLSILSYSVIFTSFKKVRIYNNFPCMSGMMIGMTIGMVSGFLPGFFVGATNGMFWGSLWGMLIGIVFGVWSGKCCGIMGVMEGMMAGFMGGIMGAMTAIMMFNDNLRAFAVIVFLISSVIILGLNMMIKNETRNAEAKKGNENYLVVAGSFVLTLLTIILMVFGPRSLLLR